jgi:hypothetical protein
MEEQQVPPSQPAFQMPLEQITPDQLNELKARARELAVRQAMAERPVPPQPIQQVQQPQIIYVRRNLTVAELLIVLLLSCGIVTGMQLIWRNVSQVIPSIEVRVK